MSSSNLIFISNKCIIFFNRVLFFLAKSLCLLYGYLGRTFIRVLLMFLNVCGFCVDSLIYSAQVGWASAQSLRALDL
ncbi:hypothetical protein KC19_VG332500 [Ceratodon purpureus]|uniref:Uncharacterized protein n=1 Tax=Ceratodon purpureus TaxID=3225 RepID=A0A8T0HW47_CERPU|nr:hypothetical protein KC19_VG332500 [Ceratodon purpureus]